MTRRYLWTCETQLISEDDTQFDNNAGIINRCIAKLVIDESYPIELTKENIKRLWNSNVNDLMIRLRAKYIPEEFQDDPVGNGCDDYMECPSCMHFNECETRKEQGEAIIKEFHKQVQQNIEREVEKYGNTYGFSIVEAEGNQLIDKLSEDPGSTLRQRINFNNGDGLRPPTLSIECNLSLTITE